MQYSFDDGFLSCKVAIAAYSHKSPFIFAAKWRFAVWAVHNCCLHLITSSALLFGQIHSSRGAGRNVGNFPASECEALADDGQSLEDKEVITW